MNKAAAEFKASFTVNSDLKWPSSTYTLFLEPSAPAMNLMFYGGWRGRGGGGGGGGGDYFMGGSGEQKSSAPSPPRR